MIRNKFTNVPPVPTRRMRKERQNFMVRNGATRASVKNLRTYDDFVNKYFDLIDNLIDPRIKRMVTPEFSALLSEALLFGEMGLSVGDMGGLPDIGTDIDISASYPTAKEVKEKGEEIKNFIKDEMYQQFIKPIKAQFNGS